MFALSEISQIIGLFQFYSQATTHVQDHVSCETITITRRKE